MYRSLSYLDDSNIVNINRDDGSRFRLDTLTTYRLHQSPVVCNKLILITHTDYVNSYPSMLQTTSYNFTKTKTTGEICAGIVKEAGVFLQNPAQHYADLKMLEEFECIKSAFINNNTLNQIECIRVDGSTDEGPSDLEVQYWWTVRHIQHPTVATLVTARIVGPVTLIVLSCRMVTLPTAMQIFLYHQI